MSIISTVEATPSRLKMLYAYLEDKTGEDKSRLSAIAGPKALQTRGDGSTSPTTVKNSIEEATKLGLLAETDDRISVISKLDSRRRRVLGYNGAFAELVEGLLFNRNSPSWASQRSFAPALAWLMTRSPRSPLEFSANQRLRLREDLGVGDDYLLTNNANWQNFAYWSRALGYCSFIGLKGETFVVTDPTDALKRHLREILPEKADMPVPDMILTLSERCPVFEDGWARAEVEGRATGNKREIARFSESTSLALLRLRNQGVVKLHSLADAEARILDFGDSTERVTHIARAKGL